MIEQLTLSSFRGSTQPLTVRFTPNKQVALIYGENGSGKSTIVDAVDFVCNQELGAIGDRSGVTAAKYIVSVDATASDLEVCLRSGGMEWCAALSGRTVLVTPDNPPRALVLRRADITRLMEAAPADCYKALQAFITVPHIERAEEALRAAHKRVSAEVDQARRSLEQATRGLATLWQNEGAPAPGAVAWAQAQTREDVNALRNRLDALRELLGAFRETERLRAEARKNHSDLTQVRASLDKLEAAMAAEAGGTDAGDVQLVRLLEEAQRYLQVPHDDAQHCPLCGKPEAPALLLKRIETALARAATLRALLEQQTALQKRLNGLAAIQAATRAQYIEGCHSLAAAMAAAPSAFRGHADVGALEAVEETNDALLAAKDALVDLASREPILGAALDAVQKTLNQLTALRSYLQSIADANAVLAEQQEVQERLTAYLVVVEEERKRYVERLMQQIGDQVNQFYAAIHPGEALGDAAINVKSTGRASLELKARFAGRHEIPPSAFYSEAHLDTLGLCIYLAMAKNADAEAGIVVLDDVLGSLDDLHLQRVVDLLAAEAPHLGHLIITTPSRRWFEQMRASSTLNADLIELQPWGLVRGIGLVRAHAA